MAAAGGAVAALFIQEQIASRLIATGVITAVTAGAFFALSFLLNREKTRAGGLLGMSIVVLECLAAFWLIWVPIALSGDENAQFLRMVALVIYGTPATLFLLFGGSWKNSSATRIAVSACAGAFAIVIGASCLHYGQDQLQEELWDFSLVVSGYGTLAALAVVRSPAAKWNWRWIGLLCSLAATIQAALSLANWNQHYAAGEVIAGGASGFVAYANLALLCALRPAQLWLRRGSIGVALLAVLMLDGPRVLLFAVGSPLFLRGFFERAAGAAGVVAACGGLAMVVLGRLNRRDQTVEPDHKLKTSIELACPHCQTKQTIPTGDSSCGHCGLEFHLEITEPHCPACGYLLFMLRAARCPECGIELTNPVQLPMPLPTGS